MPLLFHFPAPFSAPALFSSLTAVDMWVLLGSLNAEELTASAPRLCPAPFCGFVGESCAGLLPAGGMFPTPVSSEWFPLGV